MPILLCISCHCSFLCDTLISSKIADCALKCTCRHSHTVQHFLHPSNYLVTLSWSLLIFQTSSLKCGHQNCTQCPSISFTMLCARVKSPPCSKSPLPCLYKYLMCSFCLKWHLTRLSPQIFFRVTAFCICSLHSFFWRNNFIYGDIKTFCLNGTCLLGDPNYCLIFLPS